MAATFSTVARGRYIKAKIGCPAKLPRRETTVFFFYLGNALKGSLKRRGVWRVSARVPHLESHDAIEGAGAAS